ncbi:hypothetical protein RY966_002399 [Enterobacter kobei]|nr:hypothetical protein [Enterobacter kobei]
MNEMELINFLRGVARCEVVRQDDGTFIAMPIPEGALLVTREVHEESVEFFREITT